MGYGLGGGGYDNPLEAAKQWVPHHYQQGKYTYGAKPLTSTDIGGKVKAIPGLQPAGTRGPFGIIPDRTYGGM